VADEQKTYLINIKDNLDEYANRAADAREEVNKLTLENIKLKNSDTATTAEKEKGIAALKAAQAQYRSAQTSLQNATKAQNDNKNSYNQLYKQWVEAKKQLNDMPGAYERAADGTIQLSQAYIDASKDVADAKKAVDDFNLGVNSGATNIGNYASALDGLPGPLGRVTTAVKRFGNSLKALLLNPVVASIAAMVAVLALLVKAYKETDQGATQLVGTIKSTNNVLDVMLDKLSKAVDYNKKLFSFKWKQAWQDMREFYKGTGDLIWDAAKAGKAFADEMDRIKDGLAADQIGMAKTRQEIARLNNVSKDKTKTDEERIAAAKRAMELELALNTQELEWQKAATDAELANLSAKIDNNKLTEEGKKELLEKWIQYDSEQLASARETDKALRDFYNNNEADFQNLQKLYAEDINKRTEYYTSTTRMVSSISALEEQLTNERIAAIEAEDEARIKAAEDALKIFEDLKKANEDSMVSTIKINNEKLSSYDATAQGQLKINQDFIDNQKSQIEYQAFLEKWNAEQYAQAQQSKYDSAMSLLGSLTSLLGEQTKAGKSAAVAQATIDTYLSAQQAFTSMSGIPVVGPGLGAIAAAAAIAAGLANVKSILAVNPNGGNTLGTQVQSIVQTRYLAAPVNVNTADNTVSGLAQSAEYRKDMIAALSSMKTVVTVEDINAKTSEYNKVLVGAKI